MRHSRSIHCLLAAAAAGFLSLTAAHAQNPTSVTLSDVWSGTLPTGVDPSTSVSGGSQIRSFAINNNPGSPWKGTIYLPRRNNQGAAGELGPGQVFYWKGTSTLTASGPNFSTPDGHFDTTGAGATIAGGNFAWGIGVDDADYVYVGSLNGQQLVRFNPDGTNPVLVVDTGFPGGVFARQLNVTGKGLNTRIEYMTDSRTPNASIEWKATAVDANGAPTAFTSSVLFPVPVAGSQHHQSVFSSDRKSLYWAQFGPETVVKADVASGARDTTFTPPTMLNPTGVAIDSMDRALYVVTSYSNGAIHALDPITGAITTAGGNAFIPAGLTHPPYGNYIELARYSDHHYFYLGNASPAVATDVGVFATDLPAPAPMNLVVLNPGTGTSLKLDWDSPNDPEVAGYNVYRSTASGTQGAKVNTALITTNTYTDNGLTAGTRYYYTVESVGQDPFTGSSYPGTLSTQESNIPVVPQVPAAPTNITATDTAKGGEIQVGWTTPAQFAESIDIYRSTAAGTPGTLVKQVKNPAAGQPATYTDTGLTNGTRYYYTVKAVNGIGQESTNTEQVSAVPTDTTPPTFGGISTAQDLGLPGLRLTWASGADNSGPLTYRIYTGTSPETINYSSPIATTSDTTYDLSLPLGKDVYVAVRAVDAYGNVDTNTKVIAAMPTRVIVDPDQNGGINNTLFNPQPDPAVAAMLPAPFATRKGTSPDNDLVDSGFSGGQFYYQTNDTKSKASWSLPIPTAGTYRISAFWPANINTDLKINSPGYTYHITYPDGTTETVTKDQAEAIGGTWADLATKQLTAGTLTITGENAPVAGDTANAAVASAMRALLQVIPTNVPIYKASTAITPDAQLTPAEWSGAPALILGRAYQSLIPGNWTGPNDYTGRVQLKWDDTALYIAADVTDDVLYFPATDDAHLFQRDGLEVYLGLDPNADPARTTYATPGDYQIILSADKNPTTGALTGKAYSPQTSLTGTQVAIKPTGNGYVLEAKIPWSGFDFLFYTPTQGNVIGFNLQANDNDGTTQNQDSAFSLSGKGGSYSNPQAWIQATLLGTAPAPVKGDVNLDGVFTIDDVQLALRIAGGLATANAQQIQTGDVVGSDNHITLQDVVQLDRALNGKATL